jgi:hypothetical protein
MTSGRIHPRFWMAHRFQFSGSPEGTMQQEQPHASLAGAMPFACLSRLTWVCQTCSEAT